MSKTYKKKYEEDFDDYNPYGEVREKTVNKRKRKRFVRALKVKDIDQLLEYDEDDEGWSE